MKKIIVWVLAAVLSLSMLGLAVACSKGAGAINSITSSEQENSRGIKTTNYQVRLKDSVDWPSLSEKDREKTAVAGFEQAQEKALEDEIPRYHVLGIASDGTAAFQYDDEHQVMIILVDDERVGEVAVEPAKE
jgi:hypothetical protein